MTSGNSTEQKINGIDEIRLYIDAQYISASEASWKIFHYRLHDEKPDIQRLQVHLPDQQMVVFSDNEPLQEVLQLNNIHKTMLTEWFTANTIYPEARELTYNDILAQARHEARDYTLELSAEYLQNKALHHIQSILRQYGKDLRSFPCMPTPTMQLLLIHESYLIQEEQRYNILALAQKVNNDKSRLNSDQLFVFNTVMQAEFANWLQQLGEVYIQTVNQEEDIIRLPMNIVISSQDIQDLINFVYTDLTAQYNNSEYLVYRAILAPKNDDVDIINNAIMHAFLGETITYFSADSLDDNN
ncbi:15935_t:CDS:2 [Acaulospora morrowiae]|uniref:15935_t:CDS:1 n=1 Tax=Acaulospora morrowiae TaxID=94023 RepID=A0A9N9NG21_9GLOM|nr:15935_t:CDS:2 [Acaulospora morrowiae]